jgi:hypothetical protein
MKKQYIICTILLGLFLVTSCMSKPHFQHAITDTTPPWTHEEFDRGEDKFTFAVFSDLTGGERERIFEVAVAQLNLLRPEMIMNVSTKTVTFRSTATIYSTKSPFWSSWHTEEITMEFNH